MSGLSGSSLLLTLMVGTTQYLCKDYFKCIFADHDDINNDATVGIYNAHPWFSEVVSLLQRDVRFYLIFLYCP